MARRFLASSSQYLTVNTCPINSRYYGWSLALWIKADENNPAADRYLFYSGNDISAATWITLNVKTDGTVRAWDRVCDHSILSVNDICDTQWHLCVLVAKTVDPTHTAMTLYIDDSDGVNSTSSGEGGTHNRIAFGMLRDATPDSGYTGLIARPAFWKYELTAADVSLLYKGVSPAIIRPNTLIEWWRFDSTGYERGQLGRYHLCPGTLPGWAPDPPRVQPIRKKLWSRYLGMAPAAPPAGNRRRRVLICGGSAR